MFNMVTFSGNYYFEGPRGEGRETIGHVNSVTQDFPEYPSDDD